MKKEKVLFRISCIFREVDLIIVCGYPAHQVFFSPFRHVTNQDYFPSTFVQAQCLCTGCILVQDRNQGPPEVVHSQDYNSVPIEQYRLFLKRELCDNVSGKRQYRLTPVYVKVLVGCTCARVNTSS